MKPRLIGIQIILVTNAAVFLLWRLFGQSETTFMTENFLVSWNALAEGRIWTLLTSVFSHNWLLHFFLNMFVLYGFGSAVEAALGFKRFMTFYLVAGVVASLCHSLVSMMLLDQPGLQALGASGAIAGVVVVFALLFPEAKILLFGIVPMPAIWGAILAVILDLWGLIAQTGGGGLPIGFGAHIGGAICGMLYYLFSLRRTKQVMRLVA